MARRGTAAPEQANGETTALHPSEERYRNLVRALPHGVEECDTEGVITFCNTAYDRMMGASPGTCVGQRIWDPLAEDSARADLRAYLQRLVREQPEPTPYFARNRTADGRIIDVQVDWDYARDAGGRVTGFVSVVTDVTERQRAEAALRESQQTLRAFIDNSPAIIYAKDPEGRFLFVNRRFGQVFGLSPEDAAGRTDEDVFAAPVAAGFRAADRRVFETRQPVEAEEVAPRPDGPHTYLSQKFPLLGADGQVRAVCGISTDITNRKAEEALILATARAVSAATGADFFPSLLAHLAQTVGADHALIGELVDDGTRVQTIAALADGRPAAGFAYALRGTPCQNVLERDVCVYRSGVQRHFPQDHLLVELGAKAYAGIPLRSGSGEVLGILAVLFRRELPEVEQVASVLQIFAVRAAAEFERSRAEEALQAEKERFRVLVEESPLGVSLIGRDGTYRYVNPAFTRLFGYTLEDVPHGTQWFGRAYPDPKVRSQARAAWQSDLARSGVGQARPRTFTACDKSGAEKVIHFRPTTLPSGDQLVIYEDITEQRRLEAQLVQSQKMEALGTLASGVAHDFNNLLQAISGYASLLADDLPPESRERGYLARIEGASDRAADLVRSLLAFSRKEKPELRPVDLNRQVKHALALLERAIPKMIEIRTDLCPDLDLVSADPTQLEQVVMNLGTNARDAMPQGGVLTVETARVTLGDTAGLAASGPHVLLRVSDTGRGMDAATASRIFEPFFTTKGVGEGTGLGLSTVYGIVKSHGGQVLCESTPGAGTTFSVYLPALREPAKRQDIGARPEPPPPTGHEEVLVVDDEAPLRELAEAALAARGYRVTVAATGEEALALYRARPGAFALVVLDLGMPGMGGRACLDELRRLDPGVRVIVVSGYAADGPAREVQQAGIAAFLGKPYRVSELLRRVREVLDGKAPAA